MAVFEEALQADIDRFQNRVLTDSITVLDPYDLYHHEFVNGAHGRKLGFDKIEEGTDFYDDWVSIYARAIMAVYPRRYPDALVGIADGANRLSRSIAPFLGTQVLGLTTHKVDAKTVELDDEAREAIGTGDIEFALTVEDVGTTGGTTSTAVVDLRKAGVRCIESSNFWQRNPCLPRLDELEVPHWSVISYYLPTFAPEDCRTNPEGYCAQGVLLIPHAK